MKAEAVVVAYRSSCVIAACLRSLREDPAVGKIFVVDNSPGDGTEEVAGSVTDVEYLPSRENIGYGRATNLVRDRISADYVALVNPDARAQSRTVDKLATFLAA